MELTKEQIGGLDCLVGKHPETAEPKAVAVICHGYGAPGTDLVPIGGELMNYHAAIKDCVFIFPAAPIKFDEFYDGRAWWPIDMVELQRCMDIGEFRDMRNSVPEELETRTNEISQIIEHAMQQYQLPARKIVIGGFSQGSMLTTNVALNFREPLGGLIVWSGTLLNEENWRKAAERQGKLNVVMTHGRQDQLLPTHGAEALRDLLSEFGHDTELVLFNGPHTIPGEGYVLATKLLVSTIEA